MEPVLFYYGAFILVSLLQLASSRVDSYGGWNQAPDTQYHIQTDEGDERYFKYQTKTGQYRKEKRLQDGTVIGTYGWVDANGNLRLQDYMADNSGYHILKSRMLFVGDTNDIGSSVAAAKNVPPTGGELVSPQSSPFNTYAAPNRAIYVPPLPPSRNPYLAPHASNQYVPPAPTTPASTYLANVGPQYFPSTTASPVRYYTASSTAAPTPTPAPYQSSSAAAYYSTSTPAPYYQSSTPATYYKSSTPGNVQIYQSSPSYYASSTPSPIHYFPSSTPQVDINLNAEPKFVYSTTAAPPAYSSMRPIVVYSLTDRPTQNEYASPSPVSATPAPAIPAIGYTASTPSPQVRPSPIAGKYASPVNNFITETEKNNRFYEYERNRGYYNKRYVDHKPREQDYDGISTVQNGFRYFLPKMYHEEQSSRDGSEKTGSFGYVDPFGIRRVVYYNSSPGRGFVHRKNNRYVGHNAAPYDPRPS